MFRNTTTGRPGPANAQTEPAAFAGVVARQPRLGINSAAVLRRREEQPCPFVFLALLLRGHPVALVDPGREHRTIRIEAERRKTLALVTRRDRLQLGKALAAIARPGGKHLAVERLVPEDRKRQRDAAVFLDDDLGTRIRAPIELELFLGHLNRRRKAAPLDPSSLPPISGPPPSRRATAFRPTRRPASPSTRSATRPPRTPLPRHADDGSFALAPRFGKARKRASRANSFAAWPYSSCRVVRSFERQLHSGHECARRAGVDRTGGC